VLSFNIFGVTIYMVTRTKKSDVTILSSQGFDIEKMAKTIAEAVASKIASEFLDKINNCSGRVSSLSSQSNIQSSSNIQMDESIIPTKLSLDIEDVNIEDIGKEEIKEDKNIKSSRAKLAGILKKK